jgi:RimJ/RimL family protein N-acetyltransferase
MTVFSKGKLCELHVRSDHDLDMYNAAIMQQDTTKFMLTGSYPMRDIDSQEVWAKERAAGDILFSIVLPFDDDSTRYFQHPRGSLVGVCGIHSRRDIYQSGELRILIFDKDAVGKGIGTEAVKMLVDYGFNRLNLHRIWLGVNADNDRAVKCYLKAGFKEEGRLREDIFYHGKWADAIRMGILRSEWKGLDA